MSDVIYEIRDNRSTCELALHTYIFASLYMHTDRSKLEESREGFVITLNNTSPSLVFTIKYEVASGMFKIEHTVLAESGVHDKITAGVLRQYVG